MKSTSQLVRIGLSAAALGLALGTAVAQPGGPGPGPGPGYGRGPGYGFGPNNTPGWSLMTEQERTEHQTRMHSLKSYDECKSYMSDFTKKMQQRAKEKGTTVRGPNEYACDNMRDRGFFK